MSLYPEGHAPFVPRYTTERELVQWIAEIAEWTEQNRALYMPSWVRHVAASDLEVLRAALFRNEQLSGTEPLPAQRDGISRLQQTVSDLRNSVELQALSFSHGEPYSAAMRPWRRVELTSTTTVELTIHQRNGNYDAV